MNHVDWKFMFYYENVHQQVNNLNKTTINIFSNFIPNKHVSFVDKDPPWTKEKLKEKIKWKRKVYRDYIKNDKTEADYIYVQHVITEVSQFILESKSDYYNKLALKINNSKISSKPVGLSLQNFIMVDK